MNMGGNLIKKLVFASVFPLILFNDAWSMIDFDSESTDNVFDVLDSELYDNELSALNTVSPKEPFDSSIKFDESVRTEWEVLEELEKKSDMSLTTSSRYLLV
jgi:hypothetical protein